MQAPDGPAAGRQATVFVVDDEEQICTLLTRMLQREGLRVLPFRSGPEALAAAERDRPDLVITDLMMPGLNGLDLAQRVKALHPDAAVVVITGYASLENVVDALRSGVDDFVTKPFGVAEIRAVTQRVLSRRTASAAARASSDTVTAEIARPPSAHAAADPNAALARRLRDVALLESIHALLGEEVESREVADRTAPALQSALGASRVAILLPNGPDGRFRVVSLSGGALPDEADLDAPLLALVGASGGAAPVEASGLGALARHLDAGPAAASPLRPRDPGGEDAGLLVVGRPAGGRRFEGEDLRVLGVAAAALGDVFHAVRATERAEEACLQSLLDVVAATEHRAPWFLDHSARVRDLSRRLGERVGLAAAELDTLDIASQLLDLGRLHLQDDLLTKQGRLTPDEWRALRSHPEVAEALVRPLGRLRHVKPVIRHHHENWDGTGYPDGLRGDDIPLLAAIVRITDAYAALTAARPWRGALAREDAVRRLVDYSGSHFHPQLVAAFAEMELGGAAAP